MREIGSPERERTESEIPTRDSADMRPRSALPATARQLAVLAAIERFRDSRGYPPTVRDLCEALGVSSTNGMVTHLDALARKGYLARDAGTPRGLRVLIPSQAAGTPMQARPLAKTHSCKACGRRTA